VIRLQLCRNGLLGGLRFDLSMDGEEDRSLAFLFLFVGVFLFLFLGLFGVRFRV
jgi:hypothetical protein